MSSLFKDFYNKDYINILTDSLTNSYSEFKKEKFTESIFNDKWTDKELKQRMRHIAKTLHEFLPFKYSENIRILKTTFSNIPNGYTLENMIFQDYVEVFGLDEFDISMQALEHFTIESSSEFAIRRFIVRYPEQTMKQMKEWSKHPNHHVRRLASEGSRPRLPWAIALQEFKKNPSKTLEILEILKDDESEYVRKSVANNLNDISKDNPEIVKQIAKEWIGQNKNRDKIVKHGCRTLLKASNKEVLELFGFTKASNISIENINIPKQVKMNEDLEFSFSLISKENLGTLRVEYAISFLRKNSNHSFKIFKISEGNFSQKNKHISKKYSFKPITTRKYYTGTHYISIIVNGDIFYKQKFILKSF